MGHNTNNGFNHAVHSSRLAQSRARNLIKKDMRPLVASAEVSDTAIRLDRSPQRIEVSQAQLGGFAALQSVEPIATHKSEHLSLLPATEPLPELIMDVKTDTAQVPLFTGVTYIGTLGTYATQVYPSWVA